MFLSRLLPSSMMTRSRKRELEEEYRNIFPLIKFPNEILFKIYPNFDLASRRALRINGRLADIEKEMKYGYKRLRIVESDADVHLIFFGENLKIPLDRVKIPHSDLERELKLLGKHTHFLSAHYVTSLRDCDLEYVVQNKERVFIEYDSVVTGNGIALVYEKMRDHKVDLMNFQVKVKNVEDVWIFLERIGNLNRDTLHFTTTNPNQRVTYRTMNVVVIEEGNLEIGVKGIKADEDGEIPPTDLNHQKARFIQIEIK